MIHSLRLGLLIILASKSNWLYAQPSKDASVACYKTAIKEPFAFYGNSMETFMLYDGTKWKVANGGTYQYTPFRYRDVLICPTEGILVIDKKALPVGRLSR